MLRNMRVSKCPSGHLSDHHKLHANIRDCICKIIIRIRVISKFRVRLLNLYVIKFALNMFLIKGVNEDFTFCKLVLGEPSTANRTPAKQVEHTEYTVSFLFLINVENTW